MKKSRHHDHIWQANVLSEAQKQVWILSRECTKNGQPDQSVIGEALDAVLTSYTDPREQSMAMLLWATVATSALAHTLNQQAIATGQKSYYEYFIEHRVAQLENQFHDD